MKKYGEDVAIVEENPKIEKVYDNNTRQGEEIVIKKGTPNIKKLYYEDINGQPTIKKEEIIEEGIPTVIKVGTKGIINDLNVQKSDIQCDKILGLWYSYIRNELLNSFKFTRGK